MAKPYVNRSLADALGHDNSERDKVPTIDKGPHRGHLVDGTGPLPKALSVRRRRGRIQNHQLRTARKVPFWHAAPLRGRDASAFVYYEPFRGRQLLATVQCRRKTL